MFGDKKINKLKDTERSLISETVSIEGTINSSGAIDVAGLIKGPVYSKEIIVRETGYYRSAEGERIEIQTHGWKSFRPRRCYWVNWNQRVILGLLTI